MGHVSALIVYSRGTRRYHTLKKLDLADSLFEILEVWGTWSILEWC